MHTFAMLSAVTYNLHGFNQGSLLLNELCKRFDIIAIQELWLCDFDDYKLTIFNDLFMGFTWSAMTEKISNGILIGRPFGGIGLLVRRSPNVSVSTIEVHHLCRCVANMLPFPGGFRLLFIIVYLPCQSSDAAYKTDLADCLGFIENFVISYPCDAVMVLGDFNFNCDANCNASEFMGFTDELKLVCCESLGVGQVPYTYYQESSGKQSVIDHIFVDVGLSNSVCDYRIFDECVNLSDHCPVVCQLFLDVESNNSHSTTRSRVCNNANRSLGGIKVICKGTMI